MGKRIIQQRRGRGTLSYRVPRQAFRYRIQIPRELKGEGEVLKLLNSTAHTAPLAKIKYNEGIFFIPACEKMIEGQKMNFDDTETKDGNIVKLKNLSVKTKVYCIESRPGDGGKFIKTGGNSAMVNRIINKEIFVLFPSKIEKKFHPDCRAVVGVIAGGQRLDKPIIKAGKQHYIKKSRNKLWPRTSAVKMNVIDHPFGGGRGKNPKSKIAKRNAPAGRRVGLIRPRRTGHQN